MVSPAGPRAIRARAEDRSPVRRPARSVGEDARLREGLHHVRVGRYVDDVRSSGRGRPALPRAGEPIEGVRVLQKLRIEGVDLVEWARGRVDRRTHRFLSHLARASDRPYAAVAANLDLRSRLAGRRTSCPPRSATVRPQRHVRNWVRRRWSGSVPRVSGHRVRVEPPCGASMSANIYVLVALGLISVLFAIVMLMVWRWIDAKPHLLAWAGAFVAASCHWGCLLRGELLRGGLAEYWVLGNAFAVATVSLVLLGFRIRARDYRAGAAVARRRLCRPRGGHLVRGRSICTSGSRQASCRSIPAPCWWPRSPCCAVAPPCSRRNGHRSVCSDLLPSVLLSTGGFCDRQRGRWCAWTGCDCSRPCTT